MNRRCAITGAKGFIGGRVAAYFREQGWEVVEMFRGADKTRTTLPFSLQGEVTSDDLTGIDALIHCAYDFSVRSEQEIMRANVDGTRRLFEVARGAGIRTRIFLSSVSAYEGCESLYGQAKLQIEREAQELDLVIVRPGLVYGKDSGGLVGAMQKAATSLPVVPLIGDGNYKNCLVHIEDLCAALFVIANEDRRFPGPLTAASEKLFTFREIVHELAVARNRRPLLLPLPWPILFHSLRLLETVGMRPRFRSDSIIGAVKYNPSLDFSSTAYLGINFRPFRADEL